MPFFVSDAYQHTMIINSFAAMLPLSPPFLFVSSSVLPATRHIVTIVAA